MVFKFRIPSGLSGALGVPARLICPYKTASLGATSKSKVYETRPANIDDPQQRIRVCISGLLKEMVQWYKYITGSQNISFIALLLYNMLITTTCFGPFLGPRQVVSA
jgi:hypothetical protein